MTLDCNGCKSLRCNLKTILSENETCPCSYCLTKGICYKFCSIMMDFLRTLNRANTSLPYMDEKVIRIIMAGTRDIIYIYKEPFQADLLSRISGDRDKVKNRKDFQVEWKITEVNSK